MTEHEKVEKAVDDVEMQEDGEKEEEEVQEGEEVLDYEDEGDMIPVDIEKATDPFYLRYYSGHQGKYGHEFLGEWILV
ncbi:hypothetical protein TRICI_005968 [Trichomonascus ciferrii]|uniref:Uncharacterized protein n=1 Tax=Trichomonascus ciferrii TaxID=44093 RepID=A0A642UMK5_9ASCO|nr:hypothetical protein TRICI_005968 [Trichomonascus ciferrii]